MLRPHFVRSLDAPAPNRPANPTPTLPGGGQGDRATFREKIPLVHEGCASTNSTGAAPRTSRAFAAGDRLDAWQRTGFCASRAVVTQMTPERWREVDRVFQDALSRPEPDRAAFLAEIGANDASLRS